jgi:hypothetical protein
MKLAASNVVFPKRPHNQYPIPTKEAAQKAIEMADGTGDEAEVNRVCCQKWGVGCGDTAEDAADAKSGKP